MEAYTREELYDKALTLINAMILAGPENEAELHVLLGLLDPDPELVDFASLVESADAMIIKQYQGLQGMIDELS